MNNINPIIIKLLENRGIKTQEDILEFLSLNPKKTYDPFLLYNMEEAIELIEKHLKENNRICIYGDYDADGITSVTMLYEAFETVSADVFYYIPSRMEEGYGLNKEAIDQIISRGTKLLITVDCGSVSFDEVEYAKERGLDVIVTDHHNITDTKANCILVNPKQPGCTYPFKGLAGVGVTFKLVQAMTKRNIIDKRILAQVLDLAAIGTIGDIMPLIDENRTIVKFGLREINKGKRIGITALIGVAGLKKEVIDAENIAYIIVPHLNASGRIADATKAVELLLSKDGADAKVIASELADCNNTRKRIQEETYQKALGIIGQETASDNIIILPIGEAHEGIIGIVAGKVKEKYNRPTLILATSGTRDEYYKGTGRSIDKLNLYELLKNGEELYEKFGGHSGACGFLIKKDHFEDFKNCIDLSMKKIIEENKKENIDIFDNTQKGDLNITLEDISEELAEQLEIMAPFGPANPKPLFELDNLIIKDINYLGVDKTHVRFKCQSGCTEMGCILFGKAQDYKEKIEKGDVVKLVVSPEFNYWNNTRRLQLVVTAIGE